MAISQPFGVSCRGGLNTNLNQLELLAQPGLATQLLNYEVDADGGYRRVNGYNNFGDTKPNAGNRILGLFIYADGVIVCSGDGIFFSIDGEDTWLQINRASVSGSGDNYSTFTGRSLDARTGQLQSTFSVFEGNTEYGEVIICDGINKPFLFKITGTGELNTRTFFASEITVSGDTAPTVSAVHDKHLVVAGASTAKNTIFYSSTSDIDSFSGSGAGSILLDDQVVGLKSFRTDLIIFCKNSIFKLININDSQSIAIVPVTKNVGCLNSHTIQEIGGDLVFLSPDGIRSVAGTARIGDVELGSVSRQIQAIIKDLSNSITDYILTSAVLRSKSQYRLFYSTPSATSASSRGIIGTLTSNGFEWSETQGIQAHGFTSQLNFNGVEKQYHGDNSGYVYEHDIGNTFRVGETAFNVVAKYTTPSFDFGDIGTRKTMYYIKISISPEGLTLPTMRVRYDYEDRNIPQPTDYSLIGIPVPSVFGAINSTFGSAIFGTSKDPMFRQAIEGSGHVANFRFSTEDTNPPFAINGLYIDYVPSGRR